MRDLAEFTIGVLVAYCLICTLVLLAALPGWLTAILIVGGFVAAVAYIGLDLRRVLRWRRIARRISE